MCPRMSKGSAATDNGLVELIHGAAVARHAAVATAANATDTATLAAELLLLGGRRRVGHFGEDPAFLNPHGFCDVSLPGG